MSPLLPLSDILQATLVLHDMVTWIVYVECADEVIIDTKDRLQHVTAVKERFYQLPLPQREGLNKYVFAIAELLNIDGSNLWRAIYNMEKSNLSPEVWALVIDDLDTALDSFVIFEDDYFL